MPWRASSRGPAPVNRVQGKHLIANGVGKMVCQFPNFAINCRRGVKSLAWRMGFGKAGWGMA